MLLTKFSDLAASVTIENAEEMDPGFNLYSANVSVFVRSAPALHTAVAPFKLSKIKDKNVT